MLALFCLFWAVSGPLARCPLGRERACATPLPCPSGAPLISQGRPTWKPSAQDYCETQRDNTVRHRIEDSPRTLAHAKPLGPPGKKGETKRIKKKRLRGRPVVLVHGILNAHDIPGLKHAAGTEENNIWAWRSCKTTETASAFVPV